MVVICEYPIYDFDLVFMEGLPTLVSRIISSLYDSAGTFDWDLKMMLFID